MIIKLPSKLDLHLDSERKILALENIIKSHGEGKHLVWMPASTVKELSELEQFGHFTMRTLDALMSQIVENAYIHKEFEFYVSANFEDKHALTYSDGKLDVGYLNFINTSSTQESILLTENEHDGEIYSWGAKTYLQQKKLNSLKIKIEIFPGGGSTTFDCFNRLDCGLRFFACYVDSDKCHPKWPLGSTAVRFKKITTGYENRRYFEVLNCHEIENIIPWKILSAINKEVFEKSLVHRPENISFRAYPDHKTGLTLKEALAADAAHHDNYWATFKNMDLDTQLCNSFGENLLKDSVEYVKNLSPKRSKEHVDEDSDKDWIRISRNIASWGVASRGLLS